MRVIVAAVCCALLLSATPAFAVTDDERVQVYREFRTLFDAKNFPAALLLAQQLVELTETQYGPDDRQLVNPLTNVATTQLKLGNFPGAEAGYLRALKILELKAPNADRQLFRPLQGLGTAYLAAKQFEAAVAPLKRALDLSRNVDGLFNANQLEYLFPLIEAYVATNRLSEAEKEHTYAFRVAETAFGKSDVRMVDPLDKLAGWYEYVGRYTTARLLHDRAPRDRREGGSGRRSAQGPANCVASRARIDSSICTALKVVTARKVPMRSAPRSRRLKVRNGTIAASRRTSVTVCHRSHRQKSAGRSAFTRRDSCRTRRLVYGRWQHRPCS